MIEIKDNILLILDLDGTIIFPGNDLNPLVANQLIFFNDMHSLLITSARHPQGVKFVFEKYFKFIPTISLNGGGLHLSNWENFDKYISFDMKTLNAIYNILSQQKGITQNYYSKNSWYTNEINSEVLNEAKVTGMTPKLFSGCQNEEIIKLSIIGDDNTLRKVQLLVNNSLKNFVVSYKSNINYLEISPFGVNKTYFIKNYLDNLGKVNRHNLSIFFVGDSENDIDCVKYADHSWTYEYAPNELKKHCTILPFDNGEGLNILLNQIRR